MDALLVLTNSLTDLERILTTPIPFSYWVHLWTVTVIYCMALPFQILTTMSWITIPGTTVVVRAKFFVYSAPSDRQLFDFRLLSSSVSWLRERKLKVSPT